MLTAARIDQRTFVASSPEFEEVLADLKLDAGERDAQRLSPAEPIDRLFRLGLGAARVPTAFGGAGIGVADLFGLVFDLARADPNVAQSLRNHFLFVEGCIKPDLLPQRQGWLAPVLAGELFGGSFHEHGSTPAGVASFATTLTPVAGGFVINGDKAYSTGNLYADRLVVSATAPDGTVKTVVVPADRAGIEHLDDWDGIGQRLTGSGTTRYRDTFVHPEEVLLGPKASRSRPYGSAFAQLWLTTTIAGVLQTAIEDAAGIVQSRRRNYYHGLAEEPRHEPSVQQTLGELAANAYVAEATVRHAAAALERAWDSGGGVVIDVDLALEASLGAVKAKVVIDALAQQTTSALFDVGGATATSRSTHLDRHWRNVRTLASHNPRSYKARILGDHLLNGTPPPDSTYF